MVGLGMINVGYYDFHRSMIDPLECYLSSDVPKSNMNDLKPILAYMTSNVY